MATQYSGSWRKCEITTNPEVTYSLEASNSNIAIKDDAKGIASVIGTTPLPMDKVVSWKLNILKSEGKDGGGLYLGAAYEGIAMDDYGICDAGFFIRPFTAQLWSGAPFNYMNREYGPKKTPGTYVHDGDTIEVIMDMKNGELSYVVNGENFGVAYKNIPTWMPLYPCARIENAGTTIGLNLPEEVIIKYQNPTEKFVSEWVACPTSMFGSVSKYKDGNHKIIYKGDQRLIALLSQRTLSPPGRSSAGTSAHLAAAMLVPRAFTSVSPPRPSSLDRTATTIPVGGTSAATGSPSALGLPTSTGARPMALERKGLGSMSRTVTS